MNNIKSNENSLSRLVDSWKKTIACRLNAFPEGNAFQTLPAVILSEEMPRRTRGTNDDAKAKEMLRDLWDFWQQRRLLSSVETRVLKTLAEMSKNIDKWLGNYLDVRFNFLRSSDPAVKTLINKIDVILFLRKMEFNIFGSYSRDDDTITLYYRNLEDSSLEVFLARLRMALAFEMFSAYHARLAGDVYDDGSGEAEAVREALAGWFATEYAYDKALAANDGIDAEVSCEAAWNRRMEWFLSLRNDFPEANAHYLQMGQQLQTLNAADTEAKFHKILGISCRDMYAAYCELVPEAERRDFAALWAGARDAAGTGAACSDEVWGIIEGIIDRHKPKNIAELNAIFPPDTVWITEGRILLLGSGVIISGANQVHVFDLPALRDFAARDIFCCKTGLSADELSELED